MKVTELVTSFARPIVESFGCRLWDVEYVREGSERFLRLYIDKDGGVDIDDCEKIHRAVDPVLDEKDPIAESYHFEVCSAGLERALKRPGDFEQFMGSPLSSVGNRIPAVWCMEGSMCGMFCFFSRISSISLSRSFISMVYLLKWVYNIAFCWDCISFVSQANSLSHIGQLPDVHVSWLHDAGV